MKTGAQVRESFNWAKTLRIAMLIIVDAVLINAAAFLALYLRFELNLQSYDMQYFLRQVMLYAPINTACTLFIFAFMKLYRSLWEYAGVDELVRIAIGVMISTGMQLIGMFMFKLSVPRTFPIIYAMLLGVFIMCVRFSYRFIRRERARLRGRGGERRRTMLIGAGAAGAMALREFGMSDHSLNKVVCIIDDDPAKQGSYLMGTRIVGGRESIEQAVEIYNVSEIIFAIPTAPHREKQAILEICQRTPCRLRTLPALYQLANGEVSIKQIRDVDIEDLLGRDEVKVELDEIAGYVRGKTVLVTGGGGSIGSELCRQLARHGPKRLIIFDIYENNAYDIQQELRRDHPALELVTLIGSVRDRERIFGVMKQFRPELVCHAAAHKHVPLMEDSPAEAVKNNVFGTLNTAEAAAAFGVERFILISTDKAVNPTNIMGATKRICEMVVQMMNACSKTEYVAVRFGNVLGSNGSVIPLFRKQILAGGPVTVTDKRVIRYFMTIPEAVSLILQAGAFARGGEIFVLDMGEPVRIDELARNMIRLSGFEPDVDIPIEYTGLRPGEKLYEELLLDDEGMRKTPNALIYIGRDQPFDAAAFRAALARLRNAENAGTDALRRAVSNIVAEYIYTPNIRIASPSTAESGQTAPVAQVVTPARTE